jgi:putative nucleotidyltransferase with HDIG domain
MPQDANTGQRSYRFLQDLARDLSTKQISFPTFTGATIRVRRALADPEIDTEKLARAISSEPLLPARLIRIANSAALNPSGKSIADVPSAVMRIGHDVVRSTAVAVAMEQLKAAKDVQAFHEQTEWIWRHSLEVAAIAYVLAKTRSRLNPDEALFAGLVHDIGRFYLLSRVSAYPELAQDQGELDGLIQEWHSSIGQALLHEFALSEATLQAVAEHEHHPIVYPPRQLVDVIAVANRLARHVNPPTYVPHAARDEAPLDPAALGDLSEHGGQIRELIASLRG